MPTLAPSERVDVVSRPQKPLGKGLNGRRATNLNTLPVLHLGDLTSPIDKARTRTSRRNEKTSPAYRQTFSSAPWG